MRDMLLTRASLVQDYDAGEMGRFGNQLRSLPLLLERPFGFGPLQFRHVFPEDPHEMYVNAFASYGWLGGLSFLAFTTTTLYVGWRLVFVRSPFREVAIPDLGVSVRPDGARAPDRHRPLAPSLSCCSAPFTASPAAERRYRVSAEPQRRAIV